MSTKSKKISRASNKKDELRVRQHKLNMIKTEFEAGKIKSFEQIFAVMSESRFGKEMGMGFNTFRNKVNNPGDFTNNELIRFADIINVELHMVLRFIFSLIKPKVNINFS